MIKKIICYVLLVLLGCTALTVVLVSILPVSNSQPCVVKIQVEGKNIDWEASVQSLEGDIIYESWQGTGVFIADDLILTAGHMVNDANKIAVVWPCDYNLPALNWYQEDSALTDLGFICVKTPEIETVAVFADAIVGETVRALGNPFGYYPCLTEGIVSALNVEEDFLGEKNVFITDCPINPGNSGSPLFNKSNEIIGIVVAGYIYSDGMGFCVPAKICELSLVKYKAIIALQEIE